MKITVNAREVALKDEVKERIQRIQMDYGISDYQFIEESILRTVSFYEGLSQIFEEGDNE